VYNKNNRYSIFEAYNIGVSRAKGEILCFMHQDIEYFSEAWGGEVERLMGSKGVDACAVAGADYYRKSPSYYPCGRGHNIINIIQHADDVDIKWRGTDHSVQLAVFDGVWFCIKRACFLKIKFDEKRYKGFHFYDMDIATQLWVNGYKVYSIPNVWIKHFSSGKIDIIWLKNAFVYYDKWKDILPLKYCDVNEIEKEELEKEALYSGLRLCIRYREWHMMIKWFRIASEVLQTNPIAAFSKVMKNHKHKLQYNH
jgi:glycosyltransferase involved in cell wall biosynthesis